MIGFEDKGGTYFKKDTHIPMIHEFVANVLKDVMNRGHFDLPPSHDVDWASLIKNRQLFCAKINTLYARVRLIDTIISPTGNITGLVVFDIDIGTVTTITPRHLFYLPEQLAKLEPLGLVIRPHQLGVDQHVPFLRLQNDLAVFFETRHPRVHIRTVQRQEKKSDTIKGMFNEAIIEVRLSNQENKHHDMVDLIQQLDKGFKREPDLFAIIRQSKLEICPDHVGSLLSQEIAYKVFNLFNLVL